MDYVKFALFFSLLEVCSAVSMQDVASSLASVEDMLKALSEKNDPAAKSDTSVLKMELEEYIDDEISRKTKLKFDNDMLLRGFMTEKAIRKQLEVRIVTLKTNLDDLNSTLTASLVDHDGGWSNWGTWSECSATCGNGFKKRSRECTNPKPSAYGEYCRGQQMDIVSCNNNRCPDGGWANWGEWSGCSATCGNGFKKRSRECTNPKPSAYGEYCRGQPMDIVSCNNNRCPGGGWSNWGAWSGCSATCGNGFKSRSRECTSPKPSAYGDYCRGRPMDIVSCNTNRCPDIMSSFSVTKPKSNVNNHLTFTTTIYNLGGDFNPSTGIFTCSKPGVYMFTFTLVKRSDSTRVDQVRCVLRKNSSVVIVGHVDPTDDDTDKGHAYAGNIAVIHLNRGDIVSLSYCTDPYTSMEHWTSFSGFLLYPDV